MSTRDFRKLLAAREGAGFRVCVGLDSDYQRIPESVRGDYGTVHEAILGFNQQIVETTRDLVLAYKPNRAFYDAQGIEGLLALRYTVDFIHRIAPEVPVIFDAKYGDIGNTNRGYAAFAFDEMGADAVTLHGFLGAEALQPFLARQDKGLFVLCRTSNPGAKEFQDRTITVAPEEAVKWGIWQGLTMPLYQLIAWRVSREWNSNKNCALVVGATYPQELAEVRQIVGDDMPILIPGIGTQGGEVEATVRAGANKKGGGMIINASSSILFASNGPDFAEAARLATLKLHNEIQAALAATAQKEG